MLSFLKPLQKRHNERCNGSHMPLKPHKDEKPKMTAIPQHLKLFASPPAETFSAPKPPLTGCWHITHSGFFRHWWKMVPSIWICHFCKLCFVWCIPVRISVIWGAVQLMIVTAKRIRFPAQEQGVPVIQVVVKRFLSLVGQVFPASSFSRCYQVLMRFYAVNITRALKNIVSFSSPELRIL